MLYPPLTVRQMNLLIQFANIHAAAMKVSLSQISDPEESRRLRDDVELLESTAEDLSEILGATDDTQPIMLTLKSTILQALFMLDAITAYITDLESRKDENIITPWEIELLEEVKDAIEEELQKNDRRGPAVRRIVKHE